MTHAQDIADMSLKDIMVLACPPNEKNTKSLIVLAKLIGVSKPGIYVMARDGRLAPDWAVKIAGISQGRVPLAALHRFVYQSSQSKLAELGC